jgi:hypothetical protein
MYTDSDSAMRRAIREELPLTVHLLCTFHLSLNLQTNVNGAFRGNEAAWRFFKAAWWKLCKRSDSQTQATFLADWEALSAIVEARRGESTDTSVDKAKEWLEKQYHQRSMWAAAWTWGHPSLGVHSTQRAESTHAALKTIVTCGSVVILLKQLLSMVVKKLKDQTIKAMRKALSRDTLGQVPAVIASVKPLVSSWALDLMMSQVALLVNYSAIETSTPGMFHVAAMAPSSTAAGADHHEDALSAHDAGLPSSSLFSGAVTHLTTAGACTCQFTLCWGLPCRHVFRVLLASSNMALDVATIYPFWMCGESGAAANLVQISRDGRLKANAGLAEVASVAAITEEDRRCELNARLRRITALASKNDSIFRHTLGLLENLQQEVCRAIPGSTSAGSSAGSSSAASRAALLGGAAASATSSGTASVVAAGGIQNPQSVPKPGPQSARKPNAGMERKKKANTKNTAATAAHSYATGGSYNKNAL